MSIIAYGGVLSGLFDSDEAERFTGSFCPDGDRDSGTSKEDLYLTNKGEWIRNHVVIKSVNGLNEYTSTYTLATNEEAQDWLKEHDYPEAATRYFERPRGGRPKIGDKLITTVPARMHNEIAALSEMYDEDMPDTVRRLLTEALAHRETIGAPGSCPNL